ncbi:MAG: hypothetical protein KGN80_03250, partial [Acidobacteriota bacterium]|nr:hypothetical protein [Acidobacteriota bacterium]
MATAKKPTTRDPKSKAAPEKLKLKPEATPSKKASGVPGKSTRPTKKDPSKATPVPAETISSLAGTVVPKS